MSSRSTVIVLDEAWRSPLRQRVQLAWAVLRGRQTWGDGYPTPWAYEQVCKSYNRLREER